MIKARKKSISLLVTLVFLLSVLLPAGAAFADTTYASFTGTYKFVEAKDEQAAGVATVTYKSAPPSTVNAVYFKVTLPEGVTFTEDIDKSNFKDVADPDTAVGFSAAGDNYLEVWVPGTAFDQSGEYVSFNFGVPTGYLNIASDFAGDVKVTVEAFGIDNTGIVWAESENVLVGKVIAAGVTVKADDPVWVKAGQDKTAAAITIEESKPGQLKDGTGVGEVADTVYCEIVTSGVTFNAATAFAEEVRVSVGQIFYNDDKDLCWATVDTESTVLPGKLKLVPHLDVAPNVTGDIQIKVWSSGNKAVKETTVVVAKYGGVTAKVEKLKDNDDTVYCGQSGTLDANFYLSTTDGTNFPKDKLITMTLNRGKFEAAPTLGTAPGTLYNDGKSVYWTTGANLGKSLKVEGFRIKAKNDAEPGDITVTIAGDFGDLGEVVIGKLAKPYTVTADKPAILAEALAQAAGDITITETDDGAIDPAEDIVIEIPSGITLNGTPELDVVEGNISVSDPTVDGNKIILDVTAKSTKKSIIKLSNIKYDTGKLALVGDVELKFKDNNPGDDDSTVMATVVNAVVKSVTAAEAKLTAGSTTMTVNGKEVSMDVAPYIKNDRLYVSARYCANALGVDNANIWWDGTTKTATIMKGAVVIQMTVGSKIMKVNGAAITMDTAPELVPPGRVMLPIGRLAWALGASADWDQATQTATLTTK